MSRSALWLTATAVASTLLLVSGWWHFWFLCDDAFIAFRYVDNSQRGWGYVWNPPPFQPVEGYTSLLWVMLLDAVWTLTGIEPPESAAPMGLMAALATLGSSLLLLWRTKLPEAFESWRGPLVCVGALGIVTNRSFLMWTSSGLETPLFITTLVCWFTWAVAWHRNGFWVLAGMGIATLSALTRPDGLLFLAATPVVVVGATLAGRPWRQTDWAGVLPALAIPMHLVWRHDTYGEWLPNTYYAKVGELWLEGGINHFWLWALENSVIFWLLLGGACLWRVRGELGLRGWRQQAPVWIAISAVVAHLAYYVFRVGGDHFEFRIYQHLIPLMFASALWMLTRLRLQGATTLAAFAVFVASTWVIPWPDYLQTTHRTKNSEIGKLHASVADDLPVVMWPIATWHDHLEEWCVKHLLATPYQTHKWFRINYQNALPPRTEALTKLDGSAWKKGNKTKKSYPTMNYRSVGVTGWALPYVAIIDEYGLNDRVIARNLPRPGRFRYSAHDRFPPAGYIDCFRRNISTRDKKLNFTKRKPPLTAADIRSCEDRWFREVTEGVPAMTPEEQAAWDVKMVKKERVKRRELDREAVPVGPLWEPGWFEWVGPDWEH